MLPYTIQHELNLEQGHGPLATGRPPFETVFWMTHTLRCNLDVDTATTRNQVK
jgi:hypothetical protein